MILKTLSVLALAAALGTSAATAQRSPAGPNQAGKKQGTPKPATPQDQPPSRPKPWWMDDASKKELGLTAAQVKAIDDIYNSSKDELATYRENMDRERKELDRMIAEAKVEQWEVLRQIGRMETARSNNNTAFLMMLYRMNRQLTVEQRAKLQELERRARGGRGNERHDLQPLR
jgi:Spy/CpxP family protein refolding chaperone